MTNIKCKADVQTSYHSGTEHMPMVNVKIYAGMHDLDWETIDIDRDPEHADFDLHWVNEHVSEEQQSQWWYHACEHGYEQAETDAQEIFGEHVKVWSAGRMGGWVVVDKLPEIESWDALMLAKWKRFANFARAEADDTPRMTAELIYHNVYVEWRERQDQFADDAAAAELPILASV